MFCHEDLPATRTVLSAAATLAASAIVFKTIAADLIPAGVHDYLSSTFHKLFNRYSSHLTVVIEESDGLTANQMFEAANIFLGAKLSPSTRRIKVKKPEKDADLTVTVDRNQPIIDVFGVVKCTWVLQTERMKNSTGRNERNSSSVAELRYFELSFHKKHRETVLKKYLPFVLKKAKEIKEERRAVKLHTVDYNGTDYWSSVILNHPATFETMAMDLEKKKELLEDLDMFIRRKEYYRRVGRAWKRGYLFYGQPGTGKSSLVAAMANYLKFDVYDLDLREVQCNSDLRRLLIGTKNRSILVIEDIDCNIGLQNRDLENENRTNNDDKITLSGLLNFIDGLWSSCGDERIIVFTTNHKDRLDPALLRPGRMDVHLEMSYCTYSGFKILASNYLQLNDEEELPLFGVIKELLKKVQVTPAEIAGELMKNNNVEAALKNLVYWLQSKDVEHVTIEMAHNLT